jgi:hypothetical protein
MLMKSLYLPARVPMSAKPLLNIARAALKLNLTSSLVPVVAEG